MVLDLKQYDQAWEAARARRTKALLARDDVARHADPEADYWYRPGEVLVASADLATVQPIIEDLHGELEELELDIGFARFRVRGDIHEVVAAVRKQQPHAQVGPHHLLFGAPKWRGSPGRPPAIAPTLDLDDGDGEGAGVIIGVVDTGITKEAMGMPWVAARVRLTANDEDPGDSDGDGNLDEQGGHGTFIAGIIGQVAPGATVVVRRAIDGFGMTDEITVARAIRECIAEGAQIINLSLGGYTFEDCGSFVIDAACQQAEVVVAAAGNDGIDRPFYPAASDQVIAVGALAVKRQRASFSNYGEWVDACADGDLLHSVFLTGHEETDGDGDGAEDDFDKPFAYWSGTSFAAPQVAAAIAVSASKAGLSVRDAADSILARPGVIPGLGVRVTTRVRSHSLRSVTP